MRFGRRAAGQSASADYSHARRRGRWTGYRPLEAALTHARLAALVESAGKEREDGNDRTGN
jgi:hypothetical protein